MAKRCAWPVRTVMFRPICAYCGKAESFFAVCDYQLAILACDDSEHRLMAQRDRKSWLHKNGLVFSEDYLQEPLFKETELLTCDVHVSRSNGSIDKEGWKIRDSSRCDPAFLQFNNDKWYIPVKCGEVLQKSIIIQELKLSLPEDKHALVDNLVKKLEDGFYLAESLAYDEAKRNEQEDNKIASSSTESSLEDNISPCIHPV